MKIYLEEIQPAFENIEQTWLFFLFRFHVCPGKRKLLVVFHFLDWRSRWRLTSSEDMMTQAFSLLPSSTVDSVLTPVLRLSLVDTKLASGASTSSLEYPPTSTEVCKFPL